jgi:hypothetical protein
MKIDPASVMDGFKERAWDLKNTIKSLPNVLILMIKNNHDDGTPLWSRVAYPDKIFNFGTVEEWIKSPSRAGLGMNLGALFDMLAAAEDFHGPQDVDEARELLFEHGITAKTAVVKDARTVAKHGGARGQVDNVNLKKGGNSSSYLAGVLKRDHPDIATALEKGEYRSVRAAAIAAGIVKVKTPLDTLRSTWAKASEDERTTFLQEVTSGC